MDVATRHDDLVQLLRRRADWTTDQLAGELDVSRRTVLRDLDRLRYRGFHISAWAGPGGGVRLEPTSVLVTSQLEGSEVVALIVSVALSRVTPGVPFAAGADRALARIEAALPRTRVDELRRLMARVMIGDPAPAPPADLGAVDKALVSVFEQAFTADRRLDFRYTDAGGRPSRRSVEPHGLLLRAPLWYVIAFDPARDAPRLFRADRIRRPSLSEHSFTPRPHQMVTRVCPDAR